MLSIYQKHLTQILAVTSMAFGLTACGPGSEGQTVGEKMDRALERTEHAMENAKQEVDGAIGAASDKLDAAMHAT